MARSGKGVELFEILAERRARGKGLSRPVASEPAGEPPPDSRPSIPDLPRTGREIVFGLDTAFVIVVAVLIFVGSAYVIGLKNGQREEKDQALKERQSPLEKRSDAEAAKDIEGKPLQHALQVTGNEFTLKLRSVEKKSDADLARLRYELRHVQGQALLKEEGLDAFIFDKGGVLTLAAGLFEKRDDPALARLQAYFAKNSGPATSRTQLPYAGCSAAQTKELGNLVP
jgi:hypothetical protein